MSSPAAIVQTSIVTTFQGEFQLQAVGGPSGNLGGTAPASHSLLTWLTRRASSQLEPSREVNNWASASSRSRVSGTGGFPTRPGQALGRRPSVVQGTAKAGDFHPPWKSLWRCEKSLANTEPESASAYPGRGSFLPAFHMREVEEQSSCKVLP